MFINIYEGLKRFRPGLDLVKTCSESLGDHLVFVVRQSWFWFGSDAAAAEVKLTFLSVSYDNVSGSRPRCWSCCHDDVH